MTTRSERPISRRAVVSGLAAAVTTIPMAGCSSEQTSQRAGTAAQTSAPQTTAPSSRAQRSPQSPQSRQSERPLLAYFSRAGENYYYGRRANLTVGNTAVVARIIADLIDVDLYEIRAGDPYPQDYEATVERNKREQQNNSRPAVAGRLPDLERYSTVLLGSGLWNVRAPMIMRTFVESFDFTGRTVLPVVTYAVSGMGQVADEYTELCAGASVGEGLAVQGEKSAQARPAVEAWLRRTRLLT